MFLSLLYRKRKHIQNDKNRITPISENFPEGLLWLAGVCKFGSLRLCRVISGETVQYSFLLIKAYVDGIF